LAKPHGICQTKCPYQAAVVRPTNKEANFYGLNQKKFTLSEKKFFAKFRYLKKFSYFCTSILLTPPAVAGYKPKNTAMYTTTSTAAQFKEIAGCTCKLLTEEVIDWLSQLHSEFNAKRLSLLEARNKRQAGYGDGLLPDFPIETHAIRQAKWQVATIPADLQKRNVEITGPVDRKMIINALNSGADVFMADFEDANSPTWENCLKGQLNLQKAIRRTIDFTTNEGKKYQLA
jgi:hypothetical protein